MSCTADSNCVWNGIEEECECNGAAQNVVYVLDASGSVGQFNWNLQVSYVADQIENGVSPNSNIAIVVFASTVTTIWTFNDVQADRSQMINALQGYNYIGGVTCTRGALLTSINLFTGTDPALDRVIVLITDGVPVPNSDCPDDEPCTGPEGNLETFLISDDITLVSVIVGNINLASFSCLYQHPDNNGQIVTVNSFGILPTIDDVLQSFTCLDAPTLPPTEGPTMEPTMSPTRCIENAHNWRIEHLGQSGQFRLYDECDDNIWIKVKLDDITEIDSEGKKTNNKITNLAGQNFEWTVNHATQFNGFNAITNEYNGVFNTRNADSVMVRITTYFYTGDDTYEDDSEIVNSNVIKFSIQISNWEFYDTDNAIQVTFDVMVGGNDDENDGVLEDGRYRYDKGYIFEWSNDVQYDVMNNGVILDPIIDVANHVHTYITYTFESFEECVSYDPKIYYTYTKSVTTDIPQSTTGTIEGNEKKSNGYQLRNYVMIVLSVLMGFFMIL